MADPFGPFLYNPTIPPVISLPPVQTPTVAPCAAGGAGNSTAKPPPPPPKKKVPCDYDSITVDKPERKFTLKVDRKTPDDKRFIEVVGGHTIKPAKMSLKVLGLKGPCPPDQSNHINHVIDFTEGVAKPSDSSLNFDAHSIMFIPFYSGLLPKNPETKTYSIPVNTCDHKEDIQVIVYPDIEYKLEFTYSRTRTHTYKHSDVKYARRRKNEKETGFDLKGSITQDTYKLEIDIEKKFEKVIKAVDTAFDLVEKVQDIAKSFKKNVVVEYQFPSLTVGCNCKWEEIEGSPKCGFGYKVKVEMVPIIGVTVSLDVVGVALLSIPGVGVVVSQIKDFLEDNKIGKLTLTVAIEGNLNFEGSFSKLVTAPKPDIKLKAYGKIGISLKGEISAEAKGDIWFFSAGAGGGAKFGTEASITVGAKNVSDEEVNFYGNFSGIEITASAYFKANAGVVSFEREAEMDPITVFKPEKDWKIGSFNI